MIEINKTYCGDSLEVLKTFPDNFIDCVVTSPPYFGLRDYGTAVWVGGDAGCSHKRETKNANPDFEIQSRGKVDNGSGDAIYKNTCKKCGAIRKDFQIGLEHTPELYVEKLVSVFAEVKRVLKPSGTLWLNLGDSYAGSGRGLDAADGTWNPGDGKSKQGTHRYNKSQINRKVNENSLNKKSIDEGAIGNAWVKPPRGYKPKDLIGIPWLVAFALRNSGWYLRQDIIWHKPNPMPESVTDRCTKAHEYIFLLSKSSKYYYDAEAIKIQSVVIGEIRKADKRKYVPTKKVNGIRKDVIQSEFANKRSVWSVTTNPFPEAHFATFPPELIVDCIKAGCPIDGVVLDPFNGSGTTRIVAEKLGRNSIGIELNPKYIEIENRRRKKELGMFEKVAS